MSPREARAIKAPEYAAASRRRQRREASKTVLTQNLKVRDEESE
jgi:hypothetical protein